MSKISTYVKGLMLITFLFACTDNLSQNSDPKRRLSEYIQKNFAVKQVGDRAHLVPYLTGEVKVRFERWSEDQFREVFIDTKRQLQRVSFREVKPISPTEVLITYELSYTEKGKDREGVSRDAKITQKKLCQMILENGRWMIASVKNIKELVEYSDELAFP